MNKKFIGSLALAFAAGAGAPTLAYTLGKQAGQQQETSFFSDASEKNSAGVVTAPPSVGQPIDLTYAAEKAVNSVVFIKVTTHSKTQVIQERDPFADFFGDFFGGFGGGQQRRVQTPKRQSSGSGVILSTDGYIVTNNHVVDQADEIIVKLNDNREFKARIIGTDAATDLAVLKIEGKNLTPITITNSDHLKVGEWVLAIGNPYGLTSTVTAGIVSAKARTLGASSRSVESFIQTDAVINSGNSGGALVNAKGELVGINAMLYSQTGSYVGYGFAIPTTIMNKVVSDLKAYGTVQRALLGIAAMDVSNYIDQQRQQDKVVDLGTHKGVYIEEVPNNGAAAEAKLQKGDVIIGIDDKTIDSFGEMQEVLLNHKPGDKVTITYIRDKKKQTTRLTLRNEQGTTSTIKSVGTDDLGIGLRALTDREKEELGLSYGLLVNAIRAGKFQEAGISKGIILLQINDKPMRSLDDFDEAVKAANKSTDPVLWIRAKTQSGLNRSFTVELADSKKK